MINVSTIGLDLAMNVFQVHAMADDGTVVIRQRLRRAEVGKRTQIYPRFRSGLLT